MTLAEFKEKTKNLPDDTEIYLRTANFSGEYLSDDPCSEMEMLDVYNMPSKKMIVLMTECDLPYDVI